MEEREKREKRVGASQQQSTCQGMKIECTVLSAGGDRRGTGDAAGSVDTIKVERLITIKQSKERTGAAGIRTRTDTTERPSAAIPPLRNGCRRGIPPGLCKALEGQRGIILRAVNDTKSKTKEYACRHNARNEFDLTPSDNSDEVPFSRLRPRSAMSRDSRCPLPPSLLPVVATESAPSRHRVGAQPKSDLLPCPPGALSQGHLI